MELKMYSNGNDDVKDLVVFDKGDDRLVNAQELFIELGVNESRERWFTNQKENLDLEE
jgi:phage anti-repressor protein